MRLISFGEVDLPIYSAMVKDPISTSSGLLDLRNGAFDEQGGAMILTPRTLTYSAKVMDEPELGKTATETLGELYAEFAKGRRVLRAETRDGDLRQTFAKARPSSGWNPGELAYIPLSVVFEMDYPYWLASDDEPVYLDDGWLLDGLWTLLEGHIEDETISASPHAFTISNTGGVAVERGYVRIEPGTGAAIENVKVENTTTGHWFKYIGTLEEGDYLEIDLLAQAVRLNGDPAYGSFYIADTQQEFMLLAVGDNLVSVTADSLTGNVGLKWQWSRHYL
jgi:hypothetical protein